MTDAMHAAAPSFAMENGDAAGAAVLIAIPTFRRPEGLRKLLDALARLETAAAVRILVADNDGADGEGLKLARAAAAAGYRFPVDAIAVPQRGLTNVRNAMIRFAATLDGLDYIAMIDDDEHPSPQWLDALIGMQKRFGSDIVGGPTQPVFAPGAPAWAADCPLFYCGAFPDGEVNMIWGTCNVLFHARVLAHAEPFLFDPLFNEWGGEDIDAFMRLRSRGCRFAWAGAAVVLDDIPAGRTTFRWVTRRAFRIGNSEICAKLRWQYGRHGRLKALAYAFPAFWAHTGLFIFSLLSPERRIRHYCDAVRTAGKLAYLAGFRWLEYRRS